MGLNIIKIIKTHQYSQNIQHHKKYQLPKNVFRNIIFLFDKFIVVKTFGYVKSETF
jgi:hypothetical protein